MSSTPVATCASASSALSTSGPGQASVPCADNPSEMSSELTGHEAEAIRWENSSHCDIILNSN